MSRLRNRLPSARKSSPPSLAYRTFAVSRNRLRREPACWAFVSSAGPLPRLARRP